MQFPHGLQDICSKIRGLIQKGFPCAEMTCISEAPKPTFEPMPDAPDYLAELEAFIEEEDCSPVDAVALNPRCVEIAARFGRTPEQVAKDINREYLASYGRW
jgi:hypothetical protein